MKNKYILIASHDGEKLTIQTKVQGISAVEIIGILELKKQDIIKQMGYTTEKLNKEVIFVRKRVEETKS